MAISTTQFQSDMLRFSQQFSSIFRHISSSPLNYRHHVPLLLMVKAFSNDAVQKVVNKPSICTADELHYVHVSDSDWRLALWRYHPNPKVFFKKRI